MKKKTIGEQLSELKSTEKREMCNFFIPKSKHDAIKKHLTKYKIKKVDLFNRLVDDYLENESTKELVDKKKPVKKSEI